MKTILVTGSKGQLGWEISQLASSFPQYHFVFCDKDEFDLTDESSILSAVEKINPQIIINCAAFTAVDLAETEKETAFKINTEAVHVFASWAQKHDALLIQISTDYIFNGNGTKPYQPNEEADPINYYGYTKWLGEKAAIEANDRTIVIRTSWVYSTHGKNFVKTMLKLMSERDELKVVNDQIGCPTYAADLAAAIMQIVVKTDGGKEAFGIYHYSNSGVISWFDFAVAIAEISGSACKILPVPSSEYPTPAKRPHYSVMDISAIQSAFNIIAVDWRISLQKCISKLSAS